MGVDHGGFDVFVAKEFLDGADVVAVLEEVGGETMAKGVGADTFLYFGFLGGFFDGFLEGSFVDVVTLDDAGVGVFGKVGSGEDVLPDPFAMGVGVFFVEGVGEVDCAKAFGKVLPVGGLHSQEVLA